jgi:hypothetical protein
MTKTETYKKFSIFSTPLTNPDFNGFIFYVKVNDTKSEREEDFAFVERLQMTNVAIAMRYINADREKVETEIIDKTLTKVKTRIDFGLFDYGNEYLETISSKNVNNLITSMDDELIQQYLLKGLLHMRKSDPIEYTIQEFNPIGFCEILKITFKDYLFNATILMDDGFINSRFNNGIEHGSLFITSAGVKQILSKNKDLTLKRFSSSKSHSNDNHEKYDIAISFAGEDRILAEEIANKLKSKEISVFYDTFEQDKLWGKNLYDYLSEVYREKSKFCLMLLSKHYKDKLWTNHERKSAQARAFRENREYILPIKIDDTEILGIPETVGYLDIRNHKVDDIIELIMKKLMEI